MKETYLTWGLRMILLIPFFLIPLRKGKVNLKKMAQVFFLFMLVTLAWKSVYILVKWTPVLKLIHGHFNWNSKILAFLLALLAIPLLARNFRREIGLHLKGHPPVFRDRELMIVAGSMLLGGMIFASMQAPAPFRWETVFFELSMPGLEEELICRGFLLAILNRNIPREFNLWKTKFGWGLIVLSIYFGSLHSLFMQPGLSIRFDSIAFLTTGFMGFCFGWIKEKTGSLAMPIAVHNLTNVLNNLIVML